MFDFGYVTAIPPEKNLERDAWFIDRISPICGQMLYTFKMILDMDSIEDLAVRMANAALIEFRRFGQVDEPTVWVCVMSAMRRTMTDALVDKGVIGTSAVKNARVVAKAVDHLARSGGVSIPRLVDSLPGLGNRELSYLIKLSLEIQLIELLLNLRKVYQGETRYSNLSADLSLCSENVKLFLSLVVQGGANCQTAAQSLSLSEFEIHFMLKSLNASLLRLQSSDGLENHNRKDTRLCKK